MIIRICVKLLQGEKEKMRTVQAMIGECRDKQRQADTKQKQLYTKQ